MTILWRRPRARATRLQRLAVYLLDEAPWVRRYYMRKRVARVEKQIQALADEWLVPEINAKLKVLDEEHEIYMKALRREEMSQMKRALRKHGIALKDDWFRPDENPLVPPTPTPDGLAEARRMLRRARRDEAKEWSDAIVQPLSLLVALAAVLQSSCPK